MKEHSHVHNSVDEWLLNKKVLEEFKRRQKEINT